MKCWELWVVYGYRNEESSEALAVSPLESQFERPNSCQLRCDIESDSGTARTRDCQLEIAEPYNRYWEQPLYP